MSERRNKIVSKFLNFSIKDEKQINTKNKKHVRIFQL